MWRAFYPIVKKVLRSRYLRIATVGVPHRLARLALRCKLPRLALVLSALPKRVSPQAPQIAMTRAKAFDAIGDTEGARKERSMRLRSLIQQNMTQKNLTSVLRNMAELELLDTAASFAVGRWIANLVVSDTGRAKLLRSALKAQRRIRQSAFLEHIISMCQAMEGDYRTAGKRVAKRIHAPHATAPKQIQDLQAKLLEGTWRVIDQIARERMDWADAPDQPDPGPSPNPSPNPSTNLSPDPNPSPNVAPQQGADTQAFKESLLQGRQREAYLKLCLEQFEAAQSLTARLSANFDMVRSSVRHVPDYTASFEQARTCFDRVAPEIDALCAPDATLEIDPSRIVIRDLCTYIRLAKRLGSTERLPQVIDRLEQLSQHPEMLPAMWGVPAVLHKDADARDLADTIMQRVVQIRPKINADVQAYFQWAINAHRYSEADAFFERLSDGLRRRHGALHYVNILQRQSRFAEALKVLRAVHGQILANPVRVNAFTNYSLIKRTGELEFLIETARLYSAVPQPQDPKGIALIAPRNIDQLRRQPLMVLIELKRRGWAVVPLVEGLLPREPTGLAEIDVLNSAIHANTELSQTAKAALPELINYEFVPEQGRFLWNDIDLSHALWEDAAINRRRHSIDWHCPELVHYLTGLAKWTGSMAQVLDYTRAQSTALKIPVGITALFCNRLPDALTRLYCEAHGDPDTFFCVQVANGYQNYFTNFSTNVSQRLVMRNVTRTPEVRSGSFPIPDNFERYFKANRRRIPEAMKRFAPITAVKRSTVGSSGRPPEADALDDRIATWRAKGGKVACAFGKVVCDSGLPFDGGPGHRDMRDWINHCVRAVQGSKTLLLIKPHPHELNNQVATFPTEYFRDLIDEPLGENAVFLGHRWFDMDDMRSRMDVGVVYNGTTTIELGLLGIPAILAGHFGPIDYPIGQVTFKDRDEFEALLRFEKPIKAARDVRKRAAMWLDYMANEDFTQPYRFHTRPVTNKVLYPPKWFSEDLKAYGTGEIKAVEELTGRFLGTRFEPGAPHADTKGARQLLHTILSRLTLERTG